MSQPTFSVILPTYNRAASIGRSLESILNQSRPAEEVIVVDDGSTEDLGPALRPYEGRITMHRQPNAGVAAARNTGVELSSGTWLTFLDSDDIWLPDRLANLERDLKAVDADIVAHIGNVTYVGEGYRQDLFSIKGEDFPAAGAVRVEDPLPFVISGMTLQGAAIRRDVFDRTGGFDQSMRMMSDTDFFCQLALEGPFLATGAMMSEIERLEGDNDAITSLHRTKRLYGRQMHVHYLERVMARDLTRAQRKLVAQRLSGALFRQAQVHAETDRAAARRVLVRAARLHPSAVKGWVKAAIAGLLGPAGYKALQIHHNPLDRS